MAMLENGLYLLELHKVHEMVQSLGHVFKLYKNRRIAWEDCI
jgi:hypothetical protein